MGRVDEEFEALFKRYEEPLCTYFARMTGDVPRAQELTQETFLRAYRAMARGETWESPRAWLYRVASRLAVNEYRRRKQIPWLPLSSRDSAPGPPHSEECTARLDLQAALATLPPRYRAPLLLAVVAEYRVAEIAAILDVSPSAVKMRLMRAREMLRRVCERQR